MNIRTVVAAACAIVACMPSSTLAAAADTHFPNRPVRLLVPVVPGGGTDVIARLLAQRLSERWGQSVVVDNRAGATGLIALELLARAAPDGHTLATFNAAQLLTAQLSGKLSFRRGGDFTPIARSANTELLLVANAGVPAKSLKELVALARAKPRTLNYASGGAGSLGHLGLALFAGIAGIELTHVPYKGTGQTFPDLLSGQVQLILTSVAPAIQHVQTGRLRALAVAGANRITALPEVPTFSAKTISN